MIMTRSTAFNKCLESLLVLSRELEKNQYPGLLEFLTDVREGSKCQHIEIACEHFVNHWKRKCEPISMRSQSLFGKVRDASEREVLIDFMVKDVNLRLGPCWISMIARARGY
jgi:hypothetical protein